MNDLFFINLSENKINNGINSLLCEKHLWKYKSAFKNKQRTDFKLKLVFRAQLLFQAEAFFLAWSRGNASVLSYCFVYLCGPGKIV
jgi:hypothetical protein